MFVSQQAKRCIFYDASFRSRWRIFVFREEYKMKKLILSALSLTFILSAAFFASGCSKKDNHTHSFTQEIAEDKYLASNATCSEGARYYYSCKCGEKGTETFGYGSLLGHKLGSWQITKQPTETETGSKMRKCTRSGCSYSETKDIPVLPHTHKFTEEIAMSDFLASAATCTQKATYYYSCKCGEKGTETFEYGSILEHRFTEQIATSEFLASAATCTQKAKYYYSCKCGEKGTETFEYGEYGDHIYVAEWTKDESKHWHASACGHNVRDGEEPHNFVNNICTKCEYDRTVKVASVTLNKSAITILVGETTDLIATILPDNATDKTIVWVSSSPTVATVENGKITAVAKGTAIITATAGDLSATCSVKVGQEFLFAPVGNNYAVTAYVGDKNIVEVPATYNGKAVTVIGERAFYDCSQITEAVLPDTIKEIGVEAFGYCTSLTKIEIAACTRLKDRAFIGCTALTEIYLPDGLVNIGLTPFAECTSLEKIQIESGTVSSTLFAGNKYVKEIVLGAGVTEIAQNAFKGCSSLEKLTMPRVNDSEPFNNYYFGITPIKYTMSGSGSDNLYPEATKAYTYTDSNGVSHVFGLPLDGTDWYYDGNGVTYNGLYYSYTGEPITVSSWQNWYESTVGVNYKKPKTWSADFYYTPDTSLKTLIITDQMISVYNDVFTGLGCEIKIKQKFPVKSVTLVGDSEVYIDEFDFNDYLLKVTYTDGFSEIFPFAVEYLQNDLEELKTAGEKTLNLNYNGFDGEFEVTLKLHVFSSAYMDDLIVVADGSLKNLAVNGVPEGTVVSYENNGQTQVGEYIVTATLTKEYYETKILTATLKIRQEKYNIVYILGNVATNDNPTEYYYGQPLTLNNPVSKEGEFVAWYTDENYSSVFTGITTTTYGDLTLYAKLAAYYNVSGNRITGLTETGKKLSVIDIPSEIGGVVITSIGSSAFEDCSGLTSVIIHDSVTSIGYYAFSGCSGLTSITIPDRVTSIGDYAFKNCSGLTSVIIPNSVTSIEYSAFEGCSELTSITIPDSVTSIDGFAFKYCYSLKNVYINDLTAWCNISRLSELMGCSSSKNLYLKGKIIKDLVIPNSVTSIGDYAFYGCSSLISITIPDSVTSIGDYAFKGCDSLTSITIPDSVTSIGDYAFYGCSGLTGITIPDSVTSIGDYAFYGCSGLTGITIPNSVTSIGDYTFKNCSGLTSVMWNAENCTSAGSRDKVLFENCSNLREVIISDNVKRIPSWLFYNCSGLTSVTIGNSVTSIGWSAFSGCSGLTSITIPNSVTSIGSDAFRGCSGLTSITIPDCVTSIGSDAFRGCSSLTSITIPDSVTSIGGSAFEGCSRLTSVTWNAKNCSYAGNAAGPIFGSKLKEVTIGDNVKRIPSDLFYNCSGLTSVTIGDNVTSIGSSAFEGCSWLTSINYLGTIDQWAVISFAAISSNPLYYAKELYINNELVQKVNLTTAPIVVAYAFYGYSSLTSVTIGDNVTSIGDYAFRGCSGLTSVTIGNNVTSIGGFAFEGCSGLTSITIPDSITSIGNYAFSGCSGLAYNEYGNAYYLGNNTNQYVVLIKAKSTSITSCYINDNCKVLYDFSFYDCNKLTSVTIPDGVTSIGISAFMKCSGLTNVIIPDRVTSIRVSTFENCDNLTNITIPDSVTTIESYAFYGCSLKTVLYKGTAAQWDKISIGDYNTNLTNADRYYSESEPALSSDGTAYDGNYWHYDTDGVTPVIWKKEN